MHILGLNKTTLLDYPGKLAATIFTAGCDLRCPFCHNKDLVFLSENSTPYISSDEIFNFISKRRKTLQGICISGGEPCLQTDLYDFISKIKSYDLLVKLDTNGFHPDVLSSLLRDGLIDYVAMDIKNTKQKYEFTTGTYCDLSKLDASIDILKNSNIDYEFRTTIVKEFHTYYDMEIISDWISFAPHYYLQSFVDSGNIISEGLHAHEKETLEEFLEICKNKIPNTKIRGVD